MLRRRGTFLWEWRQSRSACAPSVYEVPDKLVKVAVGNGINSTVPIDALATYAKELYVVEPPPPPQLFVSWQVGTKNPPQPTTTRQSSKIAAPAAELRILEIFLIEFLI